MSRCSRTVALALAGALLVALSSARAAAPEPAAIAARLAGPEAPITGAGRVDWERLRAFYGGRDHRPVWGEGAGAGALAVLAKADAHGLDPARYQVAALAARGEEPGLERELLLSDGVIRYFVEIGGGRIDPSRIDPKDYAKPAPTDGVAALKAALAAGDVAGALQRAAPVSAAYARLVEALAAVRAQAAAGSWPMLPEGEKLSPGDTDARVAILCRRLAASGETRQPCAGLTTYGEALARDVRAFQARHGLAADGVVGVGTRARLNLQAAELAEVIALNLERWRWLPEDPGRRHVLVNMAGFDLRVVEDGREVLSMPIVVGRAYFHTPIFSSVITHLVLNPTWFVPPRIAREVLLPKIKADPEYLSANGYRVLAASAEGRQEVDPAAIDWGAMGRGELPYLLRQRPGPKNALGRIKFELPNPFAVYLHDTPDRNLFQRRVRAFSSGCIRLARAEELALYLLGGRWTAEALGEAIAADKTRTLTLPAPVPVHLQYLTAWVDGTGTLQFREDIYGRDRQLKIALARVRLQTHNQ